ncbi:MAG: glucuronate isomerase, partial [Cetobacterium sp.]
LANLGLLSRFVGMLTDSRSFLSYTRHEYFRRILCNLLGEWVENGEIPNDVDKLGKMVQNICYNNIENYIVK